MKKHSQSSNDPNWQGNGFDTENGVVEPNQQESEYQSADDSLAAEADYPYTDSPAFQDTEYPDTQASLRQDTDLGDEASAYEMWMIQNPEGNYTSQEGETSERYDERYDGYADDSNDPETYEYDNQDMTGSGGFYESSDPNMESNPNEVLMMPPRDIKRTGKSTFSKLGKSLFAKRKFRDFTESNVRQVQNSEEEDLVTAAIKKRTQAKLLKACFFCVALAVAAFCLLPVVLTFLNSFMSTEEISVNYGPVFSSVSNTGWNQGGPPVYMTEQPHLKFIPDTVSIAQYQTVLFESPTYLLKFWNSVYYTGIIVIFQIAVGALAAYSFSRYRRKRREVLFFSYIILMLMPFQVTLVPNFLISRNLGILNTRASILLPGIFSTFSVFLLTKYMRQIPSSYIEAAKLDGAGEWQIFSRIAVPMTKSALYAMAILIFVDYWNMVEQPLWLLQKSEDLQPLSVFLSQINQGEVGIAFAASFIFMVPPLLIFMHGEQYLVEGISHSGLK